MPTRSAILALAIATSVIAAGCTSMPSPVTEQAPAAARAAANKRNALAFYNAFFNKHDLSAAERYVSVDYIQHNPRVGNGRAAFVQAFTQIFAAAPQRHSTIYKAIAEDDLVALHVHTVTGPNDRGNAIVDIFRFGPDGKIIEHWDVIQAVPETSASGNDMFGQ